MEYITAEHLEKYENILQKIDSEYEICQQLEKQIKRENDKIVAANIALYEDMIKNKLFRVNVRVFDAVFEIFDYFGSITNGIDDLLQFKHCKFYLVEVYVSTVFQDKLANQKWLLNVKIKSSRKVVSQSLNLKGEAFTYPLVAILPFDCSERNCTVETSLLLPSKDIWTTVTLEHVHIDISFHFKINKLNICNNKKSKTTDIINICNCYHKDSNMLQGLTTQNIRESIIPCNIQNFLKYLIKNSYHRVDVDMFSTLEISKYFDLEIKIDDSANDGVLIYFNPDEKVLKIKASVSLLYEMKRFFIMGLNEREFANNEKALKAFSVCIFCYTSLSILACFFRRFH